MKPGPRVGLLVVGAASRLVPRNARAAWRREWEAEIVARWEDLSARSALTLGARADLVVRACGSVVDAVFYGRGRWSMGGFGEDVKMAARSLVRRPGLSAVVVVTLAIGIGAATAMFGVARDVLLRPFPYPDPERVVAVEEVSQQASRIGGNVSYPNIADLEAAATRFEAIGAARWWIPALEHDAGSVVLPGAIVTGNFFEILGVEAGLGRFFRADEAGEGREPQVVISHALWMERFGGDPGIVGREVRLSGETHRVIGVTGADFEDPWIMDGPGAEPRIWRTVASPPSEWPRSGRSWVGIGRLRPDASVPAAQDELEAVFAGLEEAYPEHNAGYAPRITPLRERVAGPAAPLLRTLLGAIGLLLLIACANLANLMLGRALDRRGELAVHRALGAPGWRILNRCAAEAAILAVVGGAAGIALAVWLGGVARALGPMLPRPVTGAVDPFVVGFSLGVTALCALLFGAAPAIEAARAGDALPEHDEARGRTAGRRSQRLRRALVVAELALTTTLLVGSGLLVRSLQRLETVDLGLRTAGVVGVELHGAAWWELEPDAAQAQWDAVLGAVRAASEVEAAGAIDYLPLGPGYSCDGVVRPDMPPPEPGEGGCAEVRVVLPGALETLDVSLIRGRMIDRRDGLEGAPVALIDERMAETLWPGADPLGKGLDVHTRIHEVVGIVENMRHFGPGAEVRPTVYLSAPQEGWNGIARGLALVARGPDPDALVASIRRAVTRVNGSIALGEFQSLDTLLDRSMSAPRFRAALMTVFATVALFLAVLGIAGVMAYSVSRRTRELGLRVALGARPAEVQALVLREGVRLVVIGVALGIAGALAVAGTVDRLLYEVSARDPLVFVGVAVVLAGAALTACWLPARRAGRVDPVEALAAD